MNFSGIVCLSCTTLLLLASPSTTNAQLNVQKLKIERSGVTGLATFVTAKNHDPLWVAKQPAAGVQAGQGSSALEALKKYGSFFGVTDATTQLVLSSTKLDILSRTTTSFNQTHKGVPVFTGILKVHEDFTGAALVINGHFFPISDKLNVIPTLSRDAAEKAAKFLMPINADVEQAKLVIVDPGWYGDPSIGAHLAYHVILYKTATSSREAFFIDAHTGTMLDHWTMIYNVKDRRIYDGLGLGGLPGTLVRSEGGAAVGLPIDVDRAYDYYGDVYDYFSRGFGRDSLDGLGLPMVATVNSTSPTCPNAFWSGSLAQMVFCDGTVTDDIVGHELAHGITENTSGLIYQNQSGQLNESVSDIFGELVDLFNGDAAFAGVPGGTAWPTHPTGPGLDTPNNLRTFGSCSLDPTYADGVRWLVGEDAAIFGGAIRDMMNPPCFNSPDRANSDLQQCQTFDSGGVHRGSGIPNHAFALLTDGGTFNSVTIAGIGPIKSGAVWYRAQTTYWTPGTDFLDASIGLTQAAMDLEGTFPNDPRTGSPSTSMFTASDTQSVINVLVATEMDTPGRCGRTRDVLDATSPTQCANQLAIFDEDFESGLGAWTVSNSAPPTPYDWVLTTTLPFGGSGLANGSAAFIDNLVNACPGAVVGGSDETASHRLDSPTINLPMTLNFPTLKFDHVFMAEPKYDGGNISISVNGGAFQLIPASAFYFNAYNTSLLTGSNPIGGQAAFTNAGTHWGTSLVHLGNMVSGGDSIRVRFEFGKDACAGAAGWFIDNVRVYDCTTVQDCNNNNAPDELEPINSPPPNVVVQNPSSHSECFWSDVNAPGVTTGTQSIANRFELISTKSIEQLTIWGEYINFNSPPPSDNFVVNFRADTSGLPIIETRTTLSTRLFTGIILFGFADEYKFIIVLSSPVTLAAGTYWVEIYNDLTSTGETFCWTRSQYTVSVLSSVFAEQTPGVSWFGNFNDMALEMTAAPPAAGSCSLPPALAVAPHDLPKNKYISIDASVNGTQPLAIKVTETNTGKVMWAGAPFNGPDINNISALSSTPFVTDWSAFSVLHLTGCIIQPFGLYEITFVNDPLGAALSTIPVAASATCAWGDIQVLAGPCDAGIGDIIESININTFSTTATFPRPHGDVQGDVMDGALGIGDIIASINAATVAAGTPLGYTDIASCP